MKTLKYFRTPACPLCPAAKRMLDEITPQLEGKVEIKVVDTWEAEGRQEAMNLKLLTVPSFAVDDMVLFKALPPNSDELLRKIREHL